jgi:hypothetical protein
MLLGQVSKNFISFCDIKIVSPKEKLFYVSILYSDGIKHTEQNFLNYSYDNSYRYNV